MEESEFNKLMKESTRRYRINKIKKFFTFPYRAFKASILCIRFPFLYPRNRWTDKHYNYWKINRFHQSHWDKAYKWVSDEKENNVSKGKWEVINRWEAFKISFLDGVERFLAIFHFIPVYTELDAMPTGWRKAFGIQMCKEIKQALLDCGGRKMLRKYRIMQIKEKWGSLCWYDSCGCEETNRITYKYDYISRHTCIVCGKSADYVTRKGWICPYCKNCIDEKNIEGSDEYFSDIPFYGVTNMKYHDKHKKDKNIEEE